MGARRTDLLLEVQDVFPAGGEYISDWIDSADVFDVRASWVGAPQFKIEESFDGASVFKTSLSSSTPSSRADAQVVSRLFRVHVTGGTESAAFAVVVRAVNGLVVRSVDY
jgi:hypothetical protein